MDADFVREEIHLDHIDGIYITNDDHSAQHMNVNFRKDFANEDPSDPEHRSDKTKMRMRTLTLSRNLASSRNMSGDIEESGCVFEIVERIEELNLQQRYSLRSGTKKDAQNMIDAIKTAKNRRLNSFHSTIRRIQDRLHVFRSKYIKLGVTATILVFNFILDVSQSELQPPLDSTANIVFLRLDAFFTIAFSLDLIINILASPPLAFIRVGWNLLDLAVVSISLAELAVNSQGSSLNTIRTIRILRTFRAVRLLSSIAKLREIIDALLASVRIRRARDITSAAFKAMPVRTDSFILMRLLLSHEYGTSAHVLKGSGGILIATLVLNE